MFTETGTNGCTLGITCINMGFKGCVDTGEELVKYCTREARCPRDRESNP